MSAIQLRSSDGILFDIDKKAIQCSGLIKRMLEDCCAEAVNTVQLNYVKANTLRQFIVWADYHKNDKEPPENDQNVEICEWDRDFLKMDHPELFDLILAANFLDVRQLLDMACKTVANMIRGKSPDEIRQTFNIKNDFTPEEELQILNADQCR